MVQEAFSATDQFRRLKDEVRRFGIELDTRQLEQFAQYLSLLEEGNTRVNLTSVSPADFVTVHLLDSLALFSVLPVAQNARVIDIGSGAGLPGLALKIARPDLTLELVESIGKKVAFIDHAVNSLGLSGVSTIKDRAEALAHTVRLRESFDIAVSRAVGPLSALAELTLPFVKVGGVMAAYKSKNAAPEIDAAADTIKVLGGDLLQKNEIRFLAGADGKELWLIKKITPTPSLYPRSFKSIKNTSRGK